MWPIGDVLAAADAPANASLITVIGGIVVAAVGGLTLVLVEVVKGRNSRSSVPPPTTSSSGSIDVVAMAADVAVLKDWRRETRKADDIHDRRVDSIEDDVVDLVRWHDREHPGWRP